MLTESTKLRKHFAKATYDFESNRAPGIYTLRKTRGINAAREFPPCSIWCPSEAGIPHKVSFLSTVSRAQRHLTFKL